MTTPKLSILIKTCSARNEQLLHLVSHLAPQLTPEVEVLVEWDNFTQSIGAGRQRLLEAARGDYVCFIDDDDEVPPYYIEKILANADGVDYIGWKQQLFQDGTRMKPTYHSLKYNGVFEDEGGWYRNVSHLNPTKRDLAILGRFDRAVPEDHDWSIQVQQHLKTENYIDDCMYHYFHSTEDTLSDKQSGPIPGAKRAVLPKGFTYLPRRNNGNTR